MNDKILLNLQDTVFFPINNLNGKPLFYRLCSRCTYVGPLESNFHEHLEIVFFLGGKAKALRDDRVYQLAPGDVVIANPYVIHQLILEEQYCGYFALDISTEFCRDNDIDILSLRFSEHIHDEELIRQFQKMIDTGHTDIAFKVPAVRSIVLQILVYLCQNYSHSHVTPSLASDPAWKYIHTATQYIKDNISHKLSAKEVASSVGLSEYHFMREFKKTMGHTLSSYINILRCEEAKFLLQSGHHQIKEVALMCGFEVESYFAKVFRKYTGMLPSEFVKTTMPVN